ncbi:MAG: UDP-2,3-diacylglucosamine diphosphatase [Marinilabiliaceae bacterium]|nr:UDP-2,3-diacylglucosamine diphosphatase [Marinilabiliaceae bacterium]
MNTPENRQEARKMDVAVISDVHLGIYNSKAKELVRYLKSIAPDVLILNGDIVDVWQFSKSYFPKSHLKVIRQIVKMMERGTRVHYITGNHDEVFRRFEGLTLGNFSIENKLVLEMDGKRTWVFHGDVFDVVMHNSKWLAHLGAHGYGILTLINKMVNSLLLTFGGKRISLSGRVKDAVKGKKKISTGFERTVSELAIRKGYDYVICGHIHRPEVKEATLGNRSVTYLNSGDWVDNCTALEYYQGDWHLNIVGPDLDRRSKDDDMEAEEVLQLSKEVLFKAMYQDILNN